MEEYVVILDYFPLGYMENGMSSYRNKPIAQAIGTKYFSLLEVIPKEGSQIDIHEKVYIGKGKRDKIGRVKGRLPFENLTATSRLELPYVVKDIVIEQEERFLKIFNEPVNVSARFNQIEVLPGVGEKRNNELLDELKNAPFESFDDIKKRVPSFGDPVQLIVEKIRRELDPNQKRVGKDKYILFTAYPKSQNKKKTKKYPRKRI